MLPPPSATPIVLQNIDNPLYQGCISRMFLEGVERIKDKILDNCVPKKGSTEGSLVSGFRKFNVFAR
jgi:hypothetical protein